MFMPFYDPLYLLVTAVGAAIALFAQFRVKSAFARYARVPTRAGMSGAEAAEAVCRAAGAQVRIERHQGFLSDHYDPRSKALRLSPDVYDGRSISSVAVAAHEAGHSIQDVTKYPFLGFRTKVVALAGIGSQAWSLLFFAGLILSATMRPSAQAAEAGWQLPQYLMAGGILLFGAVVLFQLITLPVEIDASRRAKAVLAQSGIVQTRDEAVGVNKVLDAAAWTYVAAAIAGILTLIYLIARFQQTQRR
jgi:Zn-dependent membrane protease YugP